MTIYSTWYKKSIDLDTLERALNLYKLWCIEENWTPEVEDVDEVDEVNVDRILYHAEKKGMEL